MVSQTSKTLLRNLIRHTETHNRIVEESDMWKLRRSQEDPRKRKRRSEYDSDDRTSTSAHRERDTRRKSSDHKRSKRESSSVPCSPHREAPPDKLTATGADDRLHKDLQTRRRILEAEEEDADRWGHTGYKTLYPEEFLTDSSSDDSSPRSRSHRKKSKKKKSKSKKSKNKEKKSKQKGTKPKYEWVVKTDS